MSRLNRRARPNHRASRAALSAALALMLILIASAAAAQSCPGNFFDTLESKTDTTAAKQDIGNACKGREVTVRGTVLEIHDDAYTKRFGKEFVTRSEVLSISPGIKVTIVADLTSADHIPSNTFNCIILTQTLQYIYDLPAAVRTIYRILAPGGVLLATVPGICCLGPEITFWPCYWAFRPASVQKLVTDAFPGSSVSVESAGNVLAAITLLHGLALEEVNRVALDVHDPAYPVIVSVHAVK